MLGGEVRNFNLKAFERLNCWLNGGGAKAGPMTKLGKNQ